ncbi:class II glutamine amidotransferase [Microbacterium sp. A204]|uniref:class II glutamine amidotransferase n=1 Tax=Microbacterium sp. A204 TaxID=3457321 RepID=UPI003FD5C1A0
MSRMIAFVAPKPLSSADALGPESITQFAELSRLHADGWGTAWRRDTGAIRSTGDRRPPQSARHLIEQSANPASARIIYLRFASTGAPASRANSQPFRRHGAAFQHNGLIAPRDRALALLSTDERSELQGTTDSEVYFALVLRAPREAQERGAAADSIASTVRMMRAHFPDACLNAMLLTADGLWVVHSPGTAAAPLAAFASSGADLERLPPGHDEEYNVMRMTTTESGTRIVSTTGIAQDGWQALPQDSLTLMTAAEVSHTAL